MINNNVFDPINYNDIPKEYKGKVNLVHMFLKDKFKANGEFDKKKARMVLNGNLQKPEEVGETEAPTVNPITVKIQLALTALNGSKNLLSAYDIAGAFLIAKVKEDKLIYALIPKEIANILVELHPAWKQYQDASGVIYVKLKSYLYGMQEAPHEFRVHLDSSLKELGFIQSRADSCFYTKKTENDGMMMLSTHVDDILLTSPNIKWQKWFEKEFSKIYSITAQKDNNNINYLGMVINRTKDGTIKLTQDGFALDIIKRFNYDKLKKYPKTPSTMNLHNVDNNSEECNKTEYLSIVMSLMYLARFTRPDILQAVTFLATRSANPTEEDMVKLHRVLRYIAGTIDTGLVFQPTTGDIAATVLADASHVSHMDGSGHGGIIIMLNNCLVYARSWKINFITRSSSETELVVLEEASAFAVWIRLLLDELQVKLKPITIFQDNMSTIIMATKGGSFKRTKHLLCKHSYVRERIANKEIVLKHLPTKKMVADMLTKPVSFKQLNKFLNISNIQ